MRILRECVLRECILSECAYIQGVYIEWECILSVYWVRVYFECILRESVFWVYIAWEASLNIRDAYQHHLCSCFNNLFQIWCVHYRRCNRRGLAQTGHDAHHHIFSFLFLPLFLLTRSGACNILVATDVASRRIGREWRDASHHHHIFFFVFLPFVSPTRSGACNMRIRRQSSDAHHHHIFMFFLSHFFPPLDQVRATSSLEQTRPRAD